MSQASVFEGTKPARHGDLALETHGMAPVPEDARYGASWRNFTVWFAPNLELSAVFTGTLAVTLGLGFWPGLAAIVVGVVLGALPVAYLATWGPKTGMGQLPLARLPFGRTIAVPAAVQWLSSVAWDALVGLFGNTVEVRAQAQMIDAGHLTHVLDVIGDLRECGDRPRMLCVPVRQAPPSPDRVDQCTSRRTVDC